MDKEISLTRYVAALNGITYPEWIKLKNAVDRSFDMHRKEAEKDLRLPSSEDVMNLIHSQFG